MRILKNVFPAAIGLLLCIAPTARAAFFPDFLGTTPSGPNTSFNYSLVFSTTSNSDERITEGNSLIAPGVVGSADFITIFDIPGFVSASGPGGFLVQTQLVGGAGPFQSPPDNPALTNVTIRWSGGDNSNGITMSTLAIVSSYAGPALGVYSSQLTNNNPGLPLNTKIGETGNTIIPVPEPATLGLLAVACGVGFTRRRAVR